MSKIIVTHTAPDFDAIGAAWLLQRFGGLEDASIVFQPIATPNADVLRYATAVVDIGREYDESRLRFDHHQFLGNEASQHSATSLVAEYLTKRGQLPSFLMPIIDLITDADGRNVLYASVKTSRKLGIHALLSAYKQFGMPLLPNDKSIRNDHDVLEFGYAILDMIGGRLDKIGRAKTQYQYVARIISPGFCLLHNAGREITQYAFEEEKMDLVLFVNEQPHTVTVGLQRHPESSLNCGDLVNMAEQLYPVIISETSRWFRHQAGFFAGRGTDKSPDLTPLCVDLDILAHAINEVYRGIMSQ